MGKNTFGKTMPRALSQNLKIMGDAADKYYQENPFLFPLSPLSPSSGLVRTLQLHLQG
jgi:hypothetical protein